MTRRARLPGADELFRATGDPVVAARVAGGGGAAAATARVPMTADLRALASAPDLADMAEQDLALEPDYEHDGTGALGSARPGLAPVRQTRIAQRSERRPSGRERHEEKITVYCSAHELIALEHARLALRGEHGLAVDRGRIVREALAFVIADLEAKGEASMLVRRLRGR